MYGITGATGQLGVFVVKALIAKSVPPTEIVALVRSPDKATSSLPKGVCIRKFDYSSTPAELAQALVGVKKLLLISSSEIGKRATQHANVIEAAKLAKLEFVAYTSALHADTSVLQLAAEHKATEQLLMSSGLPYALLRHGWYTENLFGQAHAPVVMSCAGEGRFNPATRADFAEADAVVLIKAEKNKIYEMAGDESIGYTDLANIITELSGKKVAYVNKPEAEFAKILVEMVKMPELFAKILADSETCIGKGALADESKTLSKLIGHPTTSVKQAFSPLFK